MYKSTEESQQWLQPLVDSNHFPISRSDVVDIFGGIDAQWDECNADAASEPADKTANQPGQWT